MQENTEQPKSLAQLLRESYLAEARAQQHHSRSDASSSHPQFYGPLKGKADDPVGGNDPQFPDLSAFLSQEELDKSVNLARQAIRHESREERSEVKACVTPKASSNIYSSLISEPVSLANSSAAPSTPPSTQPGPEFREQPTANKTFTSDRKMHKESSQHDNMIRNNQDTSEGVDNCNRVGKNVPYNLETQSKKEFLNKAADFIEELSSLFKANSSKRIRPRACKTHRSRNQNKSQKDGTLSPLHRDDRDRVVLSMEEERERPYPDVSHQTEAQMDTGPGNVQFSECRITEELQHNSVSEDVKEKVQSSVLTETPYPAEPPHFMQKLKSREVSEGSKVQLDCIVRGFPVPEVR